MELKKITVILAGLLLMATLIPATLGQIGGGNILNTDSEITAFTSTQTDVHAGDTETFSITVYDVNGEGDIEGVKITSTYANFGGIGITHVELVDFTFGNHGDGWNVIDSETDGEVEITYTYNWTEETPSGNYSQTASAKDEGNYVDYNTDDTTFFHTGSVFADTDKVFDSEGAEAMGANFGGWEANAGATNVTSTNYIKLYNRGDESGDIILDFTESVFAGPSGATISIDNNIEFRSTLASNPGMAGDEGNAIDPTDDEPDWTNHGSSVDGSYIFTVGAGETLWVMYTVLDVPSPCPDGEYTANYTLS